MKLSKIRFLSCVFFLAGSIIMRAQTPTDNGTSLEQQLTALEKLVLQDEQPAPASPSSTSTTNSPSPVLQATPEQGQAIRYFHALRQATLRKDFSNAIAAANNLAGADLSDAVQKAIATLLPQLQKLKDAQDADANEQLKSILDRATKAVISAKDPKELDPVLAEIGNAINQSRSGTNGTSARQAIWLQLEGVSRFVQGWQSYLVDQNAGNAMQAANDLRNLTNGNDTFMPIPRSELLARALKVSGTETQAVDSKIEVHSFDDVPAAISQLQSLQRSGNYSMDLNGLMNSLQNLQNAYLAYQDKNYAGALQQMQSYPFMAMSGMVSGGGVNLDKAGSQSSLREEIIALKDTLLIEIVQGLLAFPDAPAPLKDEHAQDYLLRLADLQEKAADWSRLQQVLEVYQQISGPFSPQSWLQEDLMGLRAYLVGEKLEAAGQSLDAIRSYRQALATLGKYFPADPPAAKLKELEKQFPELYQTALQQPITPKSP
ncbi:MAG: hypothetical protein LV481_07950 [Methylacidiphilales bacterium]|nr:hypothetical protein [Candidatus Methylacidiphilales bacterium]